MAEKVKLPKQICEEIGYYSRKYKYKSTILDALVRLSCKTSDWLDLGDLGMVKSDEIRLKRENLIFKALANGYEPILTPEEQLEEFYRHLLSNRNNPELLVQTGYRESLKTVHTVLDIFSSKYPELKELNSKLGEIKEEAE